MFSKDANGNIIQHTIRENFKMSNLGAQNKKSLTWLWVTLAVLAVILAVAGFLYHRKK